MYGEAKKKKTIKLNIHFSYNSNDIGQKFISPLSNKAIK